MLQHRRLEAALSPAMPITFRINEEESLIRTAGFGYVTPAEVTAHFSELSRVWPRGMKLDVLLDLSGCTSLPEISQLRDVVAQIQVLGGRKRFGVCAIVASRELLYGLLRVFELLANQRFAAVRVFRSVPAAIVWLHDNRVSASAHDPARPVARHRRPGRRQAGHHAGS
jgi:hypothetical protein